MNMNKKVVFIALGFALFTSTRAISSSEFHDLNSMNEQVKEYLESMAQGSPGKVVVTVTPSDKRVKLATCENVQYSITGKGVAWGKVIVNARCEEARLTKKPWSIAVQANVAIESEYLVAAHNLAQGAIVYDSDFTKKYGDITKLPPNIMNELNIPMEATLKYSVSAGTVIRKDLFKLPPVIQSGQLVTVISEGEGYSVSTEGKALTQANEGQVVQVKLNSGATLSGVATSDGKVVVKK